MDEKDIRSAIGAYELLKSRLNKAQREQLGGDDRESLKDVFARAVADDRRALAEMGIAEATVERGYESVPDITIPDTEFYAFLKDTVVADENSLKKIRHTLAQLQIPEPENIGEFIRGTEGALLLSNEYGMTIRLERRVPTYKDHIRRYNDHPLILQPIASIDCDDVICEICPGVYNLDDFTAPLIQREVMRRTGVLFWDESSSNMGVLPFKTVNYPSGVPVVVDRTAVLEIANSLQNIDELLDGMGITTDPQSYLYTPLRRMFKEAWPQGTAEADTDKMAAFWQEAMAQVDQELLIAGWLEDREDDHKLKQARMSSINLDQRIIAQRKGAKPAL